MARGARGRRCAFDGAIWMYRADHSLLALILLASAACDALPWGESHTENTPAAVPPPVSAPVVKAPPTPPPPPDPPPEPLPVEAIQGSFQAVVEGLRDKLSGRVRFTIAEEGVDVSIEVQGLPEGLKAAHIHETGDCSNLRKKSAGEHFAPEGSIHGLPDSAKHHRGDLGDVKVSEEGTGTLAIRVRRVNLARDDPRSLLERAVVIRSVREDGLGLQTGRPLACAVVSERLAGSVLTTQQLETEAAAAGEPVSGEADPAAESP